MLKSYDVYFSNHPSYSVTVVATEERYYRKVSHYVLTVLNDNVVTHFASVTFLCSNLSYNVKQFKCSKFTYTK